MCGHRGPAGSLEWSLIYEEPMSIDCMGNIGCSSHSVVSLNS